MKKNKILLKKVTGDFILNFLASAIVTGVMQIIMYPMISRVMGNVVYGIFLTNIGLINRVSAVVGSTLNNVRLIRENDYQKKRLTGDFNLILIICSTIVASISIFIFWGIFKLSLMRSILIGILILLMSVRNYWSVTYRLSLNYRNILISHIYLVTGYLCGCIVIVWLSCWELAFIVGEIFCIIYIAKTSTIVSEPYKFTSMRSVVLNDFSTIALTTLSANLLIYLDRLLLYPLIGGEAVTIYTVASLGGKYLGIVVTPMSGVLLSYYSQKDFKFTRKRFWGISLACIIVSSLSLLVIIPTAPFLTKLLYPKVYEQAMEIMIYANIAGILVVISNFIQPAILKFAPPKWQIIKEIVYGITYIGLGIILLNKYRLLGFCFANIIAVSLKIILMLVVGDVYCNTTRNFLYNPNIRNSEKEG